MKVGNRLLAIMLHMFNMYDIFLKDNIENFVCFLTTKARLFQYNAAPCFKGKTSTKGTKECKTTVEVIK